IAAVFAWLLKTILGRRNAERFLIYSAKEVKANLHEHGLLQIGAATNVYLDIHNELTFISEILIKIIREKHAVLFDVGANVGSYTLALRKHFPDAIIHAFEPVN